MSEKNSEISNDGDVKLATKGEELNDEKIGDGVAEEPPSKKAKVNNEEPKSGGRDKSNRRMSKMAKVAQEGEALLKEMGHKDENAGERRRTRSQTRGTPLPQKTQPKPQESANKRGSAKRRRSSKKDEEAPAAENEVDAKKELDGSAEEHATSAGGDAPLTNNVEEKEDAKEETSEEKPEEKETEEEKEETPAEESEEATKEENKTEEETSKE